MKKIILLLPLILLIGCTNEVEDSKYTYLEYKTELQKQEDFSEEEDIAFDTYFNIIREDEEVVNYSIVIKNPKIDMHKIKALFIHDYIQEEAFPSIGIMNEPVELLKDSKDQIILKGKIQTSEDIRNVNFKLYLEYIDNIDQENKIYYQVSRG